MAYGQSKTANVLFAVAAMAGVALLDTRGHTPGNMSLAVHTDAGVYVTSENGVATESYTPESSNIRGLAQDYPIVEDDTPLRSFLRTALSAHGYRVLDASSAGEALLLAERQGLGPGPLLVEAAAGWPRVPPATAGGEARPAPTCPRHELPGERTRSHFRAALS